MEHKKESKAGSIGKFRRVSLTLWSPNNNHPFPLGLSILSVAICAIMLSYPRGEHFVFKSFTFDWYLLIAQIRLCVHVSTIVRIWLIMVRSTE